MTIYPAVLQTAGYIFLLKKHTILEIKSNKRRKAMKYICEVCGYIYEEEEGDPENGIAPGTKWEDLPEDFICPLCKMGKQFFKKQ